MYSFSPTQGGITPSESFPSGFHKSSIVLRHGNIEAPISDNFSSFAFVSRGIEVGLWLWRRDVNAIFKAVSNKSRSMDEMHERGRGTAAGAAHRRLGVVPTGRGT